MTFRLEILRETIAWAEKLEDYAVKSTIRLDDKAQQTGGLAAAFLAAAFGFLKPDSLRSLSKPVAVLSAGALLLIMLLLIACVGACLSVTRIRDSPIPPALETRTKLNEDVLRLSDIDLDSEVKESFYRVQLALWQDTLDNRYKMNKIKATHLGIAQKLLGANIALISALRAFIIWSIMARSL